MNTTMRQCLTIVTSTLLLLGSLTGPGTADDALRVETMLTKKERSHWSFQPVRKPAVPTLPANAAPDTMRARTPVDAFIMRRLHETGLQLRSPATKRELIRRVKFDLLGLPPTPEEITRFLADERPDAYERLVDRYLASPRYGEAWGRMWLDLVRFAETAGFNADPPRPLAYKYRDYVIRSFNANKPYSRFLAEQIAGDELFPHSTNALIATGYNRMWPDESNASDVELARQDALNDLTSNFGSVFLGLSVGCAQCHDHKFDPILQSDFYRLQAFFSGIVLKDRVPVGTQQQLIEYQRQRARWLKETAAVREELHRIESQAKAKAAAVKRRKFPPKVLKAIDTAPEERTALQWQLAFWSERQIKLNEKQIQKQMSAEQRKRRKELRKRLAELKRSKPQPPRWAKVMATVEVPAGPAKTYLLAGGSYTSPEDEVRPGFLAATLDGSAPVMKPAEVSAPRPGTSGRRTRLVKWMLDDDNPFTARVMVNRIWQGHFGRGLVANANDFGTQTPPPSHPELLDWLAAEFMRSGWNIKHMHRLIMTSAVYRQQAHRVPSGESSDETLRELQQDPDNTLYWHYPRRRLTSERIRDAFLMVSGRLSTKMYGPGIKPKLPPKFSTRHSWKPSKSAFERNRRSVYIYAKRNLPYPMMKAFDFPDMHESCAKRPQTTIAPQALMLLNSDLVMNAARGFAQRLLETTSHSDLPELVRRAYLLAYGRKPQPGETRAAVEFLQQQEAVIAETGPKSELSARERAVIDFCHALLNSNAFLFVE